MRQLNFRFVRLITCTMVVVFGLGTIAAAVVVTSHPAGAATDIAPKFPGVTQSQYATSAYICFRSNQIAGLGSWGNYEVDNVEWPTLRTCMDARLWQADNNRNGRAAYIIDLYIHYGLPKYWMDKWHMYVTDFLTLMLVYANYNKWITTNAFCIWAGALYAGWQGDTVGGACGLALSYYELIHGS